MTIRWRLELSFLAILVFFGFNVAMHLWSGQKRRSGFEDMRRAVSRQILISSLHQNLNEIQKQVSLLGQAMAEVTMSGIGPEEKTHFDTRLDAISDDISELRELSDSKARGKIESFGKIYTQLSASWRSFYQNFGINHSKAIEEVVVRSEPLSRTLVQQLLPELQKEESARVESASAKFHQAGQLTDRITVFLFLVSIAVTLAVAFLFSGYLTRGSVS